jgi:thiamine biosynthesis lipoprotein
MAPVELAAAPDHLVTWAAMGTTCRVRLVGADAVDAAAEARQLVDSLEARWSRFLDSSELSRLNRAGGWPVVVSAETIEVIDAAVAWWRATGGRFDPTVLAAVVAAGYDREHAAGHGPITLGVPAPGCDGIVIDHDASTVQIPQGTGLDLGGIGKGFAADLVAEALRGRVEGALVDLGGDLRVWGTSPVGEGWPIAIEDLRDGSTLAVVGIAEGAVATSSTLRRSWSDGRRQAHHLVDPRTGAPLTGTFVSATVVAGVASAAEVLAKAALVAGTETEARGLLEGAGVAGVLVPAIGPPIAVGGFLDLCWTPPGEAA